MAKALYEINKLDSYLRKKRNGNLVSTLREYFKEWDIKAKSATSI